MVDATRATQEPNLLAVARWHRGEMLTGGTTCAETKTGYGLTVRDEARLAATAKAAGFDDITFHGACAVPPEYGKDPDGYLDLVCGPMLDAAAPLVRWLSVSCDSGLDSAQVRRVLAAGQRKGLRLRVQGNQSGPGPAVMIAVDTGAAAVDHCNHLTDTDVIALAASSTVATLLPAVDLHPGRSGERGHCRWCPRAAPHRRRHTHRRSPGGPACAGRTQPQLPRLPARNADHPFRLSTRHQGARGPALTRSSP